MIYKCKKCCVFSADSRYQLMSHARYKCKGTQSSIIIARTRLIQHTPPAFGRPDDHGILQEQPEEPEPGSPIETKFNKFQIRFQRKFHVASVPFNPGSLGNGNVGNWNDYTDIFTLQCFHGLSDAQTTETIQRFKVIALRRGIVLHLPKHGRSIRDLVTSKMMDLYEIRNFDFKSRNFSTL